MDRANGKAVPLFFDDDVRFAIHLLGHEVRRFEHSDERHGEACGVGGAGGTRRGSGLALVVLLFTLTYSPRQLAGIRSVGTCIMLNIA